MTKAQARMAESNRMEVLGRSKGSTLASLKGMNPDLNHFIKDVSLASF